MRNCRRPDKRRGGNNWTVKKNKSNLKRGSFKEFSHKYGKGIYIFHIILIKLSIKISLHLTFIFYSRKIYYKTLLELKIL